MQVTDSDVINNVHTEINLYLTNKLHEMGLLSDEVHENATKLILKQSLAKSSPTKDFTGRNISKSAL